MGNNPHKHWPFSVFRIRNRLASDSLSDTREARINTALFRMFPFRTEDGHPRDESSERERQGQLVWKGPAFHACFIHNGRRISPWLAGG